MDVRAAAAPGHEQGSCAQSANVATRAAVLACSVHHGSSPCGVN